MTNVSYSSNQFTIYPNLSPGVLLKSPKGTGTCSSSGSWVRWPKDRRTIFLWFWLDRFGRHQPGRPGSPGSRTSCTVERPGWLDGWQPQRAGLLTSRYGENGQIKEEELLGASKKPVRVLCGDVFFSTPKLSLPLWKAAFQWGAAMAAMASSWSVPPSCAPQSLFRQIPWPRRTLFGVAQKDNNGSKELPKKTPNGQLQLQSTSSNLPLS